MRAGNNPATVHCEDGIKLHNAEEPEPLHIFGYFGLTLFRDLREAKLPALLSELHEWFLHVCQNYMSGFFTWFLHVCLYAWKPKKKTKHSESFKIAAKTRRGRMVNFILPLRPSTPGSLKTMPKHFETFTIAAKTLRGRMVHLILPLRPPTPGSPKTMPKQFRKLQTSCPILFALGISVFLEARKSQEEQGGARRS